MPRNRWVRLSVTGAGTACAMLLFEAAKQVVRPTIGIWASHFITIIFVTWVAVAFAFFLQRREQRSRRKLLAECRESQRAEAELRQSEDRMRMAIEAARIGFFDWDVSQNVQLWSSTARQLLGLIPDSPADFSVLMKAVHPADREQLYRAVEGVTPQRPEFTNEHRVCWRDGTVHWIWVKGQGFFDPQGRLLNISGIAMGMDERKQAEERLRMLATASEEAANAIVLTDDQGTILWVNPAFTQMTGYLAEEAIGKNPRLLKSDKQDAGFYAALWNTITAGKVWHGELINRKKDGSLYSEEMTIAPVRAATGDISHYVAIKQDITQRKRAEQALQNAEQKYRRIYENTILGIFQTTWEGKFLSVNPALARMAGYNSSEAFLARVPSTAELCVPPERRAELRRLLQKQKVLQDMEVELKAKDGTPRTVLINVAVTEDGDGGTSYLEGTVQDITQRKAAEARVQFLAYHDALTGLPNRVLFEDRLAQALANARRRAERVAVLWLDLDHFKTINDSLGHAVGDRLLKQLAERLQHYLRAQDTVAKVGGDEFVFALVNPGPDSGVAAAADRIKRAVAREFEVQGHSLNVTCSIGISLFPDHSSDSETLVKIADLAMYCAKKNGRNNIRFFTPELNAKAEERLALENSLRVALDRDELFLTYQPQVEITTGRMIGVEALLRWRHPELGLVPPDKFIPIAENTGLIIPIGEWVLRTACAQARHWQELGFAALPVAVNVSALQLRQERFLQAVRRVLDETGLASKYLELELTERVLLSDAENSRLMLQELAHMGLRLSVDDLGTGYSSLSYLKDLPVCKLKIDRSFIQALTDDPRDAKITAALISMGHSLSLAVLAEGVETEEQMLFLRNHGCDEIQGYYFSKPLESAAVAERLRMPRLQPGSPRLTPKLLPPPTSAPWEREETLRSSG